MGYLFPNITLITYDVFAQNGDSGLLTNPTNSASLGARKKIPGLKWIIFGSR